MIESICLDISYQLQPFKVKNKQDSYGHEVTKQIFQLETKFWLWLKSKLNIQTPLSPSELTLVNELNNLSYIFRFNPFRKSFGVIRADQYRKPTRRLIRQFYPAVLIWDEVGPQL